MYMYMFSHLSLKYVYVYTCTCIQYMYYTSNVLVPYISGNSKAPGVDTLPMFCIEKPFVLVLHKEILELRGACKTESL